MGVGLADLFWFLEAWERTGHVSLVGCAPFSCPACWPGAQLWFWPELGSHAAPAAAVLVAFLLGTAAPVGWVFVSHQGDGPWQGASSRTPRHPPFTDGGSRMGRGWGEEADAVWCSAPPPGSSAAVGAQVFGSKANCFWAKHFDVVFEILC